MARRRYYKSRGKEKFTSKANRYIGTANRAVSLGSKVYSLAKKVRLLNVEVKHVNVGTAATNIPEGTAAGTGYHISPIAQGDGSTSRDGNSVKATSLHVKGKIQMNPNADTVGTSTRIMIIRQGYTNTHTAPILSDILTAPTGAVAWIWSYRNIDESKNVKVLYDKIITQNEHVNPNFTFNINKKVGNHLKWDSTAVGDFTSGQYFIFFFTDKGTADFPTVTFESRFRYVDN